MPGEAAEGEAAEQAAIIVLPAAARSGTSTSAPGSIGATDGA